MNAQPQLLDDQPGPIMWADKGESQANNQTGKPAKLKKWVNPAPPIKPAIILDAATGKKVAAYSFARGDSLQVVKPEQLGLKENCNLPILGYGYDDVQDLYAIVPGRVPSQFRTAATVPGAREVVFKPPLPATCTELYIKDYKDAFRLRRYEYKPEVTITGQYVLPFNDLAA